MSHLTSALEKLYQAIDKLETALDARLGHLNTQQRDLFAQLEGERDRTKSVARELDSIIVQMENTLNTSDAGQTDGQ